MKRIQLVWQVLQESLTLIVCIFLRSWLITQRKEQRQPLLSFTALSNRLASHWLLSNWTKHTKRNEMKKQQQKKLRINCSHDLKKFHEIYESVYGNANASKCINAVVIFYFVLFALLIIGRLVQIHKQYLFFDLYNLTTEFWAISNKWHSRFIHSLWPTIMTQKKSQNLMKN